MKRLALLALLAGLTVALTSCVIVAPPAFRFDSNWQRTTDGAFVFCSHPPGVTLMRYSFPGPADISWIDSVTEVYHGYVNRATLRVDRPRTHLVRVAGRWQFTGSLTFGEGMVPQNLPPSIEQQTIVVTPIAPPFPAVVGTTMVTVMVKTTDGRNISGSHAFDVYAHCP
jgi:hypothetical protein